MDVGYRPDRRFERGNRAGEPVVDGMPMLIVWAIWPGDLGPCAADQDTLRQLDFCRRRRCGGGTLRGCPVERVKISMFMLTAFCACVFAMCQVMEFGSAGADRGLLKEFEAIIAVVIGGALLTGGYGSVVGAALGALIFGVVQQGLFFAGVESSSSGFSWGSSCSAR
jgi:simple sugar transport system permease protein